MGIDDEADSLHSLVILSEFKATKLKATIHGVEYEWRCVGDKVMTSREWFVKPGTLRKIGSVLFKAYFGSVFGDPCNYEEKVPWWQSFRDGLSPYVVWYIDFDVRSRAQELITREEIKRAIFMGK
jgi:hypothetical protein